MAQSNGAAYNLKKEAAANRSHSSLLWHHLGVTCCCSLRCIISVQFSTSIKLTHLNVRLLNSYRRIQKGIGIIRRRLPRRGR